MKFLHNVLISSSIRL